MKKNSNTVAVIGLGYIGLPTAAMLAREGVRVQGVDVNPHVVDTINRGEIHIVENGLEALIFKAVKDGHLTAHLKPLPADTYMVVVPTPFRDHQAPDISYVRAATEAIMPLLKPGDLYIIESTSPVGTTEKMVDLIKEKRPDLVDADGKLKIHAAYCPERVLPGNVIEELECNDRVIGGIDEASTEKACEFYSIFVKKGHLLKTNTRTAEMCKLTENASRDSQIAFANELSLICDKAGIDVWDLIRLANRHPRVNILQPGCGVGGHCIAVDPWFIIRQHALEARLMATARDINTHKAFWCVEKIVKESNGFFEKHGRRPKVALMGLAFKPNIDDLRESPAKFIAKEVGESLEKGQCFFVEPNIHEHKHFTITEYRDAVTKSDIVVFLVAHNEFKNLELSPEKIVLDFCGVRKTQAVQANPKTDTPASPVSVPVSMPRIFTGSTAKKRVMVVVGTRPEAIKMAPVIRTLQADDRLETRVCVTGQHRQMLDQVMDIFGFKADVDLNVMSPNQTLGDITCKVVQGLERSFKDWKPDTVLVQGDTTTVFAAAVAAFYNRIEVGHVEAGLRTFDKMFPFPEEVNRCATTQFATMHFAPTTRSRQNLLNEGVEPWRIHVTGNTVVDALFQALKNLDENPDKIREFEKTFDFLASNRKTVLVTGHRRENFGDGFLQICDAIAEIAARDDVQFVYPVHLNPNVREPVQRILSGRPNVSLIEPLDYLSFLYLMRRSDLILTDSGGVQEEAPSLGKPVVVMRDTTERPEAVDAGTVVLAGADRGRIVENVTKLLDDRERYQRMSQAHNPYGDGKASERILNALLDAAEPATTIYPARKKAV